MKRLPIKVRVTLWYAALLVAICLLLFILLMSAADYTARAYHREKLEDAAERILEELDPEDGKLELDDLDDMPNVYAALFEEDGQLIYGYSRVEIPFEDGGMRNVKTATHNWYVLDTRVALQGHADVWLRLYTSADASFSAMRTVFRSMFLLFPALAAVALLGGYALTARAFLPVKRMTELAGSIAGGEDLSRRIGMTGSRDELQALSGVLDAMLERLERSFNRERQFTSDVAHDLRTPLTAVATQCEYALCQDSPEEKDEALNRILEKNGEMNALVGQLLTLARVESGQMARGDVCRVDEMIAKIALDMEPLAAERQMRLETSLYPCRVMGNQALLARAFINLIDNAIRYGREGGCVRITMSQEDGGLKLCFEDDGCGIAPEDLPKVFERFWRGDRSRTSAGTGIGLSIVRSVVQAHGGSIEAESEPGQGTRMVVRLPGGKPA